MRSPRAPVIRGSLSIFGMRRWANDGFYEREHYFADTPKVLEADRLCLSVARSAQHAFRNRAMRMRSSAPPSRMRARRMIPSSPPSQVGRGGPGSFTLWIPHLNSQKVIEG